MRPRKEGEDRAGGPRKEGVDEEGLGSREFLPDTGTWDCSRPSWWPGRVGVLSKLVVFNKAT